MSITNRIQELIEEKNLSKSAFAKEIGIQRSSLAHFFSGRNKPSLGFFLKIKNKYPEIDLNWIISGNRTKHKGLGNILQLSIALARSISP